MLAQLLRFECRYHLKQLSFLGAAVIFFVLGVLAVFGSFGSGVHVNGPYVVTMLVSILSLSAIFASIVFCANVVLRDTAHRTEQFIFTAPLSKPVYFISRFAGLLLAVFALLCLALLGLWMGSFWQGRGSCRHLMRCISCNLCYCLVYRIFFSVAGSCSLPRCLPAARKPCMWRACCCICCTCWALCWEILPCWPIQARRALHFPLCWTRSGWRRFSAIPAAGRLRGRIHHYSRWKALSC